MAFKKEDQIVIPLFDGIGLLANLIEEEEIEFKKGDEVEFSFQEKAAGKLSRWVESGWFRQYPDDQGNDQLEMTAETEKALQFIHSLKTKPFVGTESRFKDIFRRLRELVSESVEDPEARIAELQAQKQALDVQGFHILSQFRARHLNVKSLLMDSATLEEHHPFIVDGKADNRKDPLYLTSPEMDLYKELKVNNWRLEQKRVRQKWVVKVLQESGLIHLDK